MLAGLGRAQFGLGGGQPPAVLALDRRLEIAPSPAAAPPPIKAKMFAIMSYAK
jgi:hypothetical protein